jgi:hypothetical protein
LGNALAQPFTHKLCQNLEDELKEAMLMSRLRLHPENHLVDRIGWLRAAVLGANDGIISTASRNCLMRIASFEFLSFRNSPADRIRILHSTKMKLDPQTKAPYRFCNSLAA